MMNSSKNNNNNNNAYPRPTPQTSIGRLVSITVDNPKYHTAPVSSSPSSPTIPHLIPIASAATAHNDEQTMLWRNIATLFSRCEQNEIEIKKQREDYDPCIGVLNHATDELVQETRELKCRIGEISNELSDELDSKLGQMKKHTRKYVSKKVNNTKQAASGSAFDADLEVFKYVDTVRDEMHEELSELHDTYDRDYKMFIQRENELLAKLDTAVKMNEAINQRMKDLEECFMRQIQQVRNYADTHVAGDLREEFSTAICREVAFESKVNAELVQGVHNELTDLITRSNEYHSARYFGTVDDVKQVREMCQTLKQSIGIVDAELSDTKETVEYLKDEVGDMVNSVTDLEDKVCDLTADLVDQKADIYSEMDHDYSDMKDYVKRRIQRHVRHSHQGTPAPVQVPVPVPVPVPVETTGAEESDAISMIVNEYSEDAADASTSDATPAVAPDAIDEDDDNIIIMDDTCMISDDE